MTARRSHGRSAAIAALVAGALLLLPAAPAPAAYPGANGAIAFTSNQDGGARHLFITTAGGLTDLTGATSPATETQPQFSPDGRQIAFTRSDPGHLPNAEIFVIWADGTHRSALTATAAGNGDPTWSPDGREIAFVSTRVGQVPNIFVMRSDGTDVRQITHDDATKSELAWSPRGDRIAFVGEPARGGDRDIYSVATDGSDLRDLTNDPTAPDVDPAFSPDGSQIVYTGPGHPHGSVGADLWVMGQDGSGRHELDHESNGYSDAAFPAWSPDGATIVFSANNGTGYQHLWTVPAGGGQNTELVRNAIPGGNPLDWEADWQPAPTAAGPASTRITSAKITVRKRRATFRFTATGSAPRYECALQRGRGKVRFSGCRSPESYAHLARGRYTFEVRGVLPTGTDTTPAKRAFTVR